MLLVYKLRLNRKNQQLVYIYISLASTKAPIPKLPFFEDLVLAAEVYKTRKVNVYSLEEVGNYVRFL